MQQTFLDLNKMFYTVLDDLFKIHKHKNWDDICNEITLEKISETYLQYSKIFHANLDRTKLLPKNNPSEKLTSIFHGNLDGATIINNIARYSCYTDEILVFHPLQNSVNTNPDMDPIKFPGLWQLDFSNALYFYIVVRKWVFSGIVHLIQSPFDYDIEAMKLFWDQAKKRVSEKESVINSKEVMEEQEQLMFQNFKKSFLNMPEKVIRQNLKNSIPGIQQVDLDLLFNKIILERNNMPLKLKLDYDLKNGILNLSKSGGNIEHIDALCMMTGAHSYTSDLIIKKQLELKGTNPFWTKFSTLHSGVKLTYLDSVDVSFALKIRQEDRLSGLRSAFRNLSGFLENTELDNIKEDQILTLNDSFKYEVEKSEVEWQKIHDDARKYNWFAVTGTSVISLALDPTRIILPAIGVPSSIAINEFFKNRNIEKYRKCDPYSVYVDMKNKSPNFLTDIRHCIF